MSISLSIDHTRQETGKEKRLEQLGRWEESETNTASADRAKSRNADSSIKFQTGAIFLSACQTSDYEEIENILHSTKFQVEGIDINYGNSDGLTALHQASIDGNVKMVKYLLDKGADINVQDHEGWSCLHAAASCGYVEIAKILVDANINVLKVTSDGELAMDVIAEDCPKMQAYLDTIYKDIDGDVERTKEKRLMFKDSLLFYYYFKENGRKYEAEPINPNTQAGPMHVAAAKGYLDVLRLLLEAGFSPSCQDADGWTPMHAAAHWEQIDACRYLAAYGANFNLRNKLGQKPVDVADDSLIPEFTKLQKSRPKKENLPSLPELPPRSPTSFLPEPPQDSPPPVEEPLPPTPIPHVDVAPIPIEPKKPIPGVNDERVGSPWGPMKKPKLTEKPVEVATPPVQRKKDRYGVQDEKISLADAFNAFEPGGKPKTPRVKRTSSTVEFNGEDPRRVGNQPVPNQKTNIERKDKAKKTRKNRRSTQGVTIDVVDQAKKLFEDLDAKRQQQGTEGKEAEINSDVAPKLPSAYISREERQAQEPVTIANSMLNPNIALLMKKKEMAKKLMASQKGSKEDAHAVSKGKSGSNVSSLDQKSEERVQEDASAPAHHESTARQNSQARARPESVTTQPTQNSLTVDHGNRPRTSSNSETQAALAQQRRTSNNIAYPDHLSTIRSPVPGVRPGDNNVEKDRAVHGHRSPSMRNEDDEFRVLYENEKKKVTSLESENAELRVELKSLRQSLKEMSIKSDPYRGDLDRAIEADNEKLKQENAALIRIISKLSK